MSRCRQCGSYAINHHLHGRDGSGHDLCDVCYWRTRTETLRNAVAELVAHLGREGTITTRHPAVDAVMDALAGIDENGNRSVWKRKMKKHGLSDKCQPSNKSA